MDSPILLKKWTYGKRKMHIDTRTCTRKSAQRIDSNSESELVCVYDPQTQAETQRTFQNTTALQNYLDQHPDLSDMTLGMTADIRQKLLLYMANADQNTQEKLQAELDAL